MFLPLPSDQENDDFFKKVFLEFENNNKHKSLTELTDTPHENIEKLNQIYLFAEFGKLTSGLFHDLVSPLTAISLQIEELKIQHNHPKQIQDLVDRAFHATKHLETFLKNIRKQIQNQEEKITFDLGNEIQQAICIVSYRAKEHAVEIISRLPKSSLFFGNPIKFHQTIVNLLNNAIDAYEGIPEEKKIKVSLKRQKNRWEIQIQDYGIGIPKEQKDYIFEPLFTTKQSNKGVGLGLCMVKYKVEKEFNGSICVHDSKPQGTTFIIELPLSEAPEGES